MVACGVGLWVGWRGWDCAQVPVVVAVVVAGARGADGVPVPVALQVVGLLRQGRWCQHVPRTAAQASRLSRHPARGEVRDRLGAGSMALVLLAVPGHANSVQHAYTAAAVKMDLL